MEKKFTPGPWVADFGSTFGHIKSIAPNPTGRTPSVARYDVLPDDLMGQDEKNANAALIAASPDMLEALQSTVRLLEEINDGRSYAILKQAKQAIAKALK